MKKGLWMERLDIRKEDVFTEKNGTLIQKITLAVMFAAIGCILGRYETDKLGLMTDAPGYINVLLYLLFFILLIGFLVPKMNFKDTDDRNIISNRYYRIIIILAVTAVFCTMDPNPLGFVISLVVRLFCGVSFNIGSFFFEKDYPLVVRICLCIVDAAVFITAFHILIHYVTKLIFREKQEQTASAYQTEETVVTGDTEMSGRAGEDSISNGTGTSAPVEGIGITGPATGNVPSQIPPETGAAAAHAGNAVDPGMNKS